MKPDDYLTELEHLALFPLTVVGAVRIKGRGAETLQVDKIVST